MKYRNNQERLQAYLDNPQFFIECMVTNGLGIRSEPEGSSLSETLSSITGRIGTRYDNPDDINASIALMNWRTPENSEDFSKWKRLWEESVFDVF
jgi:hypothetical protein